MIKPMTVHCAQDVRSLPRKGIQDILYPEAPGVFLQDKMKKLTPMSTTFRPLTAWICSESETAAESKGDIIFSLV